MPLFLLLQQAAISGRWFTAPAVAAAIITSVFTIAGIALKDYLFKLLEEGRSDRKTQSEIYGRYSHSLVTSAVHLLNRLYEILYQQHRPVFLLGNGFSTGSSPGGVYRLYKKLSCVYRLAAVLGWIRACRREFSYLRVADPGSSKGIHKAINDFEHALADGNWVEWERLSRLCEIWLLCGPQALTKIPGAEGLATHVDNLIWDQLEREQVEDVSLLNDTARRALCRTVADCLSSHLRTNPVTDQSLERTWPDAFAVLAMREAWIYRDWQGAIGDVMIEPTGSDTRKFEVIGFGDFEQLILVGTVKQRLAVERLAEIFDNLDLSIKNRFDARQSQLRSVAKACADLILAIDATHGRRSVISENSRDRAKEVIVKEQRPAA